MATIDLQLPQTQPDAVHDREPAIVDAAIDMASDTQPVETTNHTTDKNILLPTRSTAQRKGAYGISWFAVVLGILVSIAGNMMHAQTKDTDTAAVALAAFWPIALFLAVEVITRVRWPRGFWYAIARYGGTGIVAAVAAVVSYRHMSGLLTHWGEDQLNSAIGPLAIDGLVVVAATALVAMNKPQH